MSLKRNINNLDIDDKLNIVQANIKTKVQSEDCKEKILNIINKKNIEDKIVTVFSNIGEAPDNFKLYTDFGVPVCEVCFNNAEIYGVFKCGHAFCSDCCSKINNCPNCRKLIDQIIYYIIEKSKLSEDFITILDLLVANIDVNKIDKDQYSSSDIDISKDISRDMITIKYGRQRINDKFTPCLLDFKINTPRANDILDIAFLIDISGSMRTTISTLVSKLKTYILNLPIGSLISIHLFNQRYINLCNTMEITNDSKDIINNLLDTVQAHGSTNLSKGLIGLRDKINLSTQVIIITDGSTESEDIAALEFSKLKETNSILIIGLGEYYSYEKCLTIVSGDATLFSVADTPTDILNCINNNIKSGIRLSIKFSNNTYYGTSVCETLESMKEVIEFINYDTNYRCILLNGLPDSVEMTDGTKINLESDDNLNNNVCKITYEFVMNDYIKTLANNIVKNYGDTLKSKMLLYAIKKRIDNDKLKIGIEIYDRLFEFIEKLNLMCHDILFNKAYTYDASRESSNGIGRAISTTYRRSSTI